MRIVFEVFLVNSSMLKTKNVVLGSYDLCNSCNHKNCCVSYDSPLITPQDEENISKTYNMAIEEFTRIINQNGNLIKILKKKKKSVECIFWDDEQKQCSIYNNRPFDCQLFPFDINYINGEYYWVIYSCHKSGNWDWTGDILLKFEEHSQFVEIMNYIDHNKIHQSFEITKDDDYELTIIRKVMWNKSYNIS